MPGSTSFNDCLSELLQEHLPQLQVTSPVQADTHLTNDLGLDSVALMQVLVLLETQYGYSIPETALEHDQFTTVAELERLVTASAPASLGEPELDIKVHCVVSCLCHPVKAAGLDHRPLYFGVWDAEVFVDDKLQLSYHSDSVDHHFFTAWFTRLYGVEVREWYDHRASKMRNLRTLESLLEQRTPSDYILVMLDMYRLPERENRFNRNPFPHYVMLEYTDDPTKIWMWDPDFRWEGLLDRERVMQAVASPAAAGGYCFDATGLHAPQVDQVAAYFDACFQRDRNGMTDAVERIVHAHARGEEGLAASALGAALSELPVLAIRKYAYEHGLAYFWRALGRPEHEFEHWCELIEALVRGFDHILFQASKYSLSQEPEVLETIDQLIREQNLRERKIKTALFQAYRSWCEQVFPSRRVTAVKVAL